MIGENAACRGPRSRRHRWLAARQAFDHGTRRPSNEDSPPLLPRYLHYFCGVIKNPVPGAGQRIRQPLSPRRPCFLFATLNVNESFSLTSLSFSLSLCLCVLSVSRSFPLLRAPGRPAVTSVVPARGPVVVADVLRVRREKRSTARGINRTLARMGCRHPYRRSRAVHFSQQPRTLCRPGL